MSELTVSASPTRLLAVEADKIAMKQLNDPADIAIDKQANNVNAPYENDKDKVNENLPSNEVESAVAEINAFVQSMQRNLSFQVDDQLGQSIISVRDVETDELIRQIPSEELVVLRKKMDDVAGILFDTKV